MAVWFRRKRNSKNGAEINRVESCEPTESAPATGAPTAENSPDKDSETSSGFFRHMRSRLLKTRQAFADRIDRLVFGKKTIDHDVLEELEEVLISSDLGVAATQKLIASLEEKLHRRELTEADRLRAHVKDEVHRLLQVEGDPLDVSAHKPFVIMAVGVNGVGKTTTLAKIAARYKKAGLEVMLVAADTFRAAAIQQLERWAERVGADLIKQTSGADPAAVVYDAMSAAQARRVDVVLIDTAGRLHTKANLMEELKKIKRIIAKQMDNAPHEILLILDATTGQNALSQTRLFHQELEVTGLVLTKLDGTAKGGIVVGACQEFQIPVRFIGLGESLDDLKPFDPEQFVAALFE